MAQLDTAAVRQRLESERDRLEREIYDRTQGEGVVYPVDPFSDTNGMSSDQADDADAVENTERMNAINRNAQVLLEQVTGALQRLDAGTYGICANCGKQIAPRRLEALPYAVLCIDCQAKIEQGAAR